MGSILDLDTETYSEVPIKHGTYAYAERCEVMLFAWSIDEGPVNVWDITSGAPMPKLLAEAIYDPHVEKWAQNAAFDRNVLRLGQLRINIPIEQWRCTMAQAYAHSLPGGLADMNYALGVADAHQKKDGANYIQLFCKPRPKNHKLRRATRETHPAEWAGFIDYAGHDIIAMQANRRKMPGTNYPGPDLAIWHLDQRINDRGMLVDTAFAQRAIEETARIQKLLGTRTRELTEDAVHAATQRDAMLQHILAMYGVELPDMRGATIERRAEDPDLPEPLRELLRIRLQASTTSTSKYKALIESVSSDGRLRGTTQYCGASRTGRWGGRRFQPHNLPRIGLNSDEMERRVRAINTGSLDLIYTNPMEVMSSTIRGAIIAPPGKKLVIADWANIEGRGIAWLAGEEWKLDAFRAYDVGTGPDLYKLAYAKAFGIDPAAVAKHQRQIGKVMELMLGYQGGVGAFVTGAASYNIDLEAMADIALPTIPADIVEDAENFLEFLYAQLPKKKRLDPLDWDDAKAEARYGLSERVFITCDSLKRLWRNAHPEIVQFWADLEQNIIDAVCNPGILYQVRDLRIRRNGAWLRIRLPSGRILHYPAPKVSERNGKLAVSYMGMHQYTRKWTRLWSYGGKFAENITQALSADFLREGLIDAEAADYLPILHVHDEIVAETEDSDEFTVAGLAEIMTQPREWAPGIPLAAAGFETYRYRKDDD